MTAAFAPVAALLLGVAFLLTGNGLQGTLLPIRAQIESFGTPAIGALGAAYYMGFAAGCFLGAHALRRAGHARVFMAMTAIASAVALAHALIFAPVFWWFARAVTGFCFAVLFMVIESWLNERSTRETRGLILSVYLIINLTVITLGQMMITLYDPSDFPLFALASILVSLAAVPVAFTVAAHPTQVEAVHVRPRRLYAASPVGFVGCVAVGLTNGSFWSLGPLFAERVGLDLAGIAMFMSITVLAGAAGQWPLGRASDKTDRRKVIAGTAAAAGLAGVLLALSTTRWPETLLWMAALYGFFSFPIYAVAVAHVNDMVSKDEFVEVSSGLLLVFAAGAVVGPFVSAAAMDLAGPRGLYLVTASVHLGLVGFAMWRYHQRARPPVEERTEFREALEVANTVSQTFEVEAIQEAQVVRTDQEGEPVRDP